ncbi:type III restriction enzyme, res subunit [Bacteriovorax sp. BSW11_IV]|nr:type III restriction enzyme, res subunit [Bacteriovorax sp. BSW11_IV]
MVIAELARIAKGRVLVLTHVKELVEQNYLKYKSYDLVAGIYSAGLGRKEKSEKVIFSSIQSVARASEDFFENFSLVIVDECHRISLDEKTQYQQVFDILKKKNDKVFFLGLTATPYRLGMGWIYNYHYKGSLKSEGDCFFRDCIYELPLSYMIDNGYLTRPVKIDSPVACYDFSKLELDKKTGLYSISDIEEILKDNERVTPGIIGHIIETAQERQGVMIFTSTVRHAREILGLLPLGQSEIVTGDTPIKERDEIINNFKDKKIKYLVNVSVLTTGFDAPHVDLIAVLRPTESVGLYQQIVGRGLRLAANKEDCLILDYTGQGHNLFSPEVGDIPPDKESVPVEVPCPECGHNNLFWGKVDDEGEVVEHFGRKCRGAHEDPVTLHIEACGFRFRFKICEDCGAENDIAARVCNGCDATLVDPDKKLQEAMKLTNAHVLRVDFMDFMKTTDRKGRERLEIRYYDYDGQFLAEFYFLNGKSSQLAFYHNFVRPHLKYPGRVYDSLDIDRAILLKDHFRTPKFVIARKVERYWKIREKVF